MIHVKGGAARLLIDEFGRVARDSPAMLALPLCVFGPLLTLAACALAGRGDSRLPDLAWFACLAVATLMALRGRGIPGLPRAGGARSLRAALLARRGEEGREPLVATVVSGGRTVLRVSVADARAVPLPARGADLLMVDLASTFHRADGTLVHGLVTVSFDPEGRGSLRFETGGVARRIDVHLLRHARVELDARDAGRAEAGTRRAATPPRGVTARAAAALAGEDLTTVAGVERARRRVGKAMHPDSAQGADQDLYGEVNAALDAYERLAGA